MTVHVIGNSHVSLWSNTNKIVPQGLHTEDRLPGYKTWHIGPTIAYNFFEHHFLPKVVPICDKYIDKQKDYVMLVCGEVDHRVWLPRLIKEKNKPMEEVVLECFHRYFKCFVFLKNYGYKSIFWGSHPSTNGPEDSSPDSPVVGDVTTRNNIGVYWNILAEKYYKEQGILFASIFKQLLNEDLTTKQEYMMDYCHLSQKALPLAIEEIKKVTNG